MTGRDVVLPPGYPELLEDLKSEVAAARWRAQRAVNTELLSLYWLIGHTILDRQQDEGWGARVIDRLSTDLQAAYPEMRGLSRSNLFYMRSFAASWPLEPIVQQPVGRLPWGHVTVLLDKLHDQPQRDWYAAAAAEYGWSRNVLLNQIMNRLHERTGAAPSNFAAQLPAKDSEMAQQLTRDPYVLDFLELTGPAAERDLEAAPVKRLQAFLLELGHGFAFVGRQYHFTVDGDDFYIDCSDSWVIPIVMSTGLWPVELSGGLGITACASSVGGRGGGRALPRAS
jgi:predicted nuclease of restriction endonuclease-like (RecB) superfamily